MKRVVDTKHKPLLTRSMETCDGVQNVFRFENGFGASVVKHEFSYGHESGLWELGVIKFSTNNDDADDWSLIYDTGITTDVMGHLDDDQVDKLLDRIKAL